LPGASSSGMRDFWDDRAREDALYFVDNRLDYGQPDERRFWDSGPRDLDALLGAVGARIEPSDAVVEIGCGVGRLTRPLADWAASVRALDVSAEMLDRARAHSPELANVEWILGDGESLAGVADDSADCCFSHVVFQHIPDPEITLGYVREMGRVLRLGGWSAFQISNDPSVHRAHPASVRQRLKALFGRSPRGQRDPAWLGSAVDLDELSAAAADGGLEVERVKNPGTQYCLVLLRKG
jgi:SAM-dependent methyltransferase